MSEGESTSSAPWLAYKPGCRAATGDAIAEILAVGKKCIVFVDASGSLQWEYDENLCIEGDASITEAQALLSQLRGLGLSTRGARRGRALIATALSEAFELRVVGDSRDFFRHARDFVRTRREETLHIFHLLAALAVALLVSIYAWYAGDLPKISTATSYATAACLGAWGALLSVLLRFQRIPVKSYSSRAYAAVGGAIRMVLGCGFGAVLLLLQQAGLLLTLAADKPAATAVCALLAGFSERLVPDLLANLDSSLAIKPEDGPKA